MKINRQKKWIGILLCLVLTVILCACGQDTENSAQSGEASESVAAKEITPSEQTTETKTAKTEKTSREKKAKATSEATESKAAEKEETEQTASKKTETKTKKTDTAKKTDKKTAKASEKKKDKKKKSSKAVKPSGHVLAVKSGGKEVYFTANQLSGMGTGTYKYSYRNKESAQRQFLSATGVSFSRVLSKSGFSGSTARFRSKDGYTKEFSVSDLKASKKAFLKKTGSSAKSVPAIITTTGADAFRLCFGQSAEDTDENGDYNAQYWVKNIDYIEIL